MDYNKYTLSQMAQVRFPIRTDKHFKEEKTRIYNEINLALFQPLESLSIC